MFIKLDYDKKVEWKRIRLIKEVFNLKIDFNKSKLCKTKKGFHVYLCVDNNNLKDEDICFFQLAMGSDFKRECLNWARLRDGYLWQKQNWNVLFSKKFHLNPFEKNLSKARLVSMEADMDNSIIRSKLK